MPEPWFEMIVQFVFRRRPYSLPGNLRPDWRIALILLILSICCRNQRSHIKRLHVLNWACGPAETRHDFQEFIDGQIAPDSVIARYEPWLIKAIALAEGESLISRNGTTVQLTLRGIEVVNEILAAGDLFQSEIEFLRSIGKTASEKRVDELLDGGTTTWA